MVIWKSDSKIWKNNKIFNNILILIVNVFVKMHCKTSLIKYYIIGSSVLRKLF